MVCSPLSELLEHDAVGEALPADADALQHAVTAELLQHQVGVHLPRLQQQHTQSTHRSFSSNTIIVRGVYREI